MGSDIVTKKLNFYIQNVMYAFVLNDCCIPHEGFNYLTITITDWLNHVVTLCLPCFSKTHNNFFTEIPSDLKKVLLFDQA